ncbi:MAG: DegT/DnrJ/EryC1/StrS family aminotransferase, partial [Rhodothermales bacterium]|nr:DegT/DnrJ/EryC1/StrS family aminotransferase [Rhodothermales bacterium]
PYFPCIHLQPIYRDRFGYSEGSFPVAEHASERSLALPFYSTMPEEHVKTVVAALTEFLPTLSRNSRTLAATA